MSRIISRVSRGDQGRRGMVKVEYLSFIIEVGKNDFTFMYVIGRGGFGKVWRVEQKKTH